MNNTIFEELYGALAAVCLLYSIPPTSKAFNDYKKIIEEAERQQSFLANQVKGLEKQNKELQAENRYLRELCKMNKHPKRV